VQDAYTTTNRYPYSERGNTDRLDSGSGLATRFNYVRNSVKVVINAYDGTMKFYVVDKQDPIVKAYQKAFPKLFTTEAIPASLKSHLRYPEDLFRVQTDAYGDYHITKASDFYDKGDAWDIAHDPGGGTVAQTPSTTPAGRAANTVQTRLAGDDRMDPFYLLMRLPNERDESFLVLQPFTPSSKQILSAFMVAKSDPNDYGTLEAFVMPRDIAVNGPAQVDAKINQEPAISSQITLLGRAGSRIVNGNLLVIPVNQSLLYVRPLYVEAENTQLPELKRVIVVYKDQAVAAPTLREALGQIFGAAPETQEAGTTTTPAPGVTPPPTAGPGVSATVQSLLDQALQAYRQAQAALKSGDLSGYQKAVDQMNNLIAQARSESASSPPSTTTTTAPASA